jgi:hypothetical protein
VARPSVRRYVVAIWSEPSRSEEILEVPLARISNAVERVIDVEAPLHDDDLVTRVAGFWGKRGGSRIRDHILRACSRLTRSGSIVRRGDFLYMPQREIVARSRESVGIPAERIPPEEYEAAVMAVLAGHQWLPRVSLTTETRTLLGFARTGAKLDGEIGRAIDALLERGAIVYNASGITRPSG